MAKTTSKSTGADKAAVEATEAVVEESSAAQQAEAKCEKPLVAKDVDLHQIITVHNGFHGPLVYKDKRTGIDYRWTDFDDEQDIELGDLRNARGSAKKFFEKNWFLFEEDWIPEYLGMAKYYKHALNSEDFDELFEKPPEEIEKIISELGEGQRKSVAYRARQLIASGEIDSRKTVSTLERCLGVELVEK